VGRARPFSRWTTVANAHVRADVLGAKLRGPFFRDLFESGPVILLSGDIGFTLSAIKATVGLDFDHVSFLPENCQRFDLITGRESLSTPPSNYVMKTGNKRALQDLLGHTCPLAGEENLAS
jgi:hypothetical protein